MRVDACACVGTVSASAVEACHALACWTEDARADARGNGVARSGAPRAAIDSGPWSDARGNAFEAGAERAKPELFEAGFVIVTSNPLSPCMQGRARNDATNKNRKAPKTSFAVARIHSVEVLLYMSA